MAPPTKIPETIEKITSLKTKASTIAISGGNKDIHSGTTLGCSPIIS